MPLTDTQLNDLRLDLVAHQLADVAALADKALKQPSSVPSGTSPGTFLNSPGELCVTLIEKDGDFLYWITASTAPQLLAEYFPQLLPYSPWGIVDTTLFPFPHLAGVELTEAHWDYIYVSTQEKRQRDALINLLEEPSRTQLQSTLAANGNVGGGLYYSGKVAVPWNKLLPVLPLDGQVTADLAWPWPTDSTIAVTGYISTLRFTPSLTLLIPLLNGRDHPFGSQLVKEVSLALALTSPLSSPEGLIRGGSQRVGVVGQVVVGKAKLGMAGSWPLDDDAVLLNFSCSLSEISSGLASDFVSAIPELGEATATASVQLDVSKKSGKLERLGLNLVLENWTVCSGEFSLSLQEVALAVTIAYPGSLNLTMASFRAKATIGSAPALSLLCTGNYPDGDFYLGLDPEKQVLLNDLIQALGVGEITFLDNLVVEQLSARYNSNTSYKSFELAIGTSSNWKNGEMSFELKNLQMGIYLSAKKIFKLSAAFTYTFTKTEGLVANFVGVAEYNEGWLLNLSYTSYTGVSLLNIAKEFDFEAPAELGNFRFKEFGLIIDVASKQNTFHGDCWINLFGTELYITLFVNRLNYTDKTITEFRGSFTTTLADKPASFAIYSKSGSGSKLELQMVFPVAGVNIYLAATSETAVSADAATEDLAQKHFVGSSQGLNLHASELLQDLLKDSGFKLPDELVPDITIEDVYVSYDGKKKQTDLIAMSKITGHEVTLFFQYQSDKQRYAVGFATDVTDLSGLPLVGSALQEARFLGVGFVYASTGGDFSLPLLSPGAAGAARTIMPAGQPKKALVKGINFTGEISLPVLTAPFSLALPTGEPTAVPASAATPVPVPTEPLIPASAIANSEKWFDMDSAIGPLHIKKVGLGFENTNLFLLISLDLSLAELVFSVEGLGMGFKPQELLKGTFDPKFELTGLGLSFSNGPIQISGAFLRTTEMVAGTAVEEYNGSILLKFENFAITGLGSYSQPKDIGPSLFLYALYDGVLGGPSFFFVTGLSAGFGYNRKVNIPSVDKVARFPLVELAVQPQKKGLSDILKDLETPDEFGKKPIEIARGEYWMAIGVRFTSFEIVQGQLLLIAQFGHTLQFNVLGLARLSLPLQEEGKLIEPFVYLELQMVAVLVPSEGYFGVVGSMSASSYVLTKDCHITGGFAYYMWYDSPDSDKKGQFVMTAGGYHPAFKAPVFYPQVARLGYNWQVSDNVSIKGTSYFAITPACGMAGIGLELLFEAGDVKAWFIAMADVLVTWHPFSFIAQVYIEIGVSVRLNLLVCHTTVTVSIGASLDLWGTPLGGRVSIHVVVVTITIDFGSNTAADKNRTMLSWSEFSALLPAPTDICKIVVNNGLIQTLQRHAGTPKITFGTAQETSESPTSSIWVVRAGTFGFTAQSAIPASQRTFNNGKGSNPEVGNSINVRPMFKTGVDSCFELTIMKLTLSGNGENPKQDTSQWKQDTSQWNVAGLNGDVASALWAPPLIDSNGGFVQVPAGPSNDVVKDQWLGYRVLAPDPIVGLTMGALALSHLEVEYLWPSDVLFATKQAPAGWPALGPPGWETTFPDCKKYPAQSPLATNPVSSTDFALIAINPSDLSQLATGEVLKNRNELYDILKASGLYVVDKLVVPHENDVLTKLATRSADLFVVIPRLLA